MLILPASQFSEVAYELEEQRELATNRLTELEKLQKEHVEAKKEIEKLKMDVSIEDVGCKIILCVTNSLWC